MKNFLKITLSLIILLIIVLGFAMPLNHPAGNWYQQFLPNIGGRTISDIFFLDSLTGWAVTPYRFQNDTAYVLKTTNSGDSWFIVNIRIGQFVGHNKVKFLNSLTGFICGVSQTSGYKGLSKSTDGGGSWLSLNVPVNSQVYEDMSILNEDTIWLTASESLTGGVFRTTNGGASWDSQFSGGNQNPNHIYMYNARIGFMCNSSAASPNIYKTTNSGVNWTINLPGEYFFDIHFTDSLTGWKCMSSFEAADTSVKKTTNGGANWIKQKLPTGGIILTSQITRFSFINKDTIYGAGGQVFYGGGRFRGMIYRTTNGGANWLFQVPDTSFGILGFSFIQFINKSNGWVYSSTGGIHTTNGGDTTFLVGIKQVSNEIPKEYILYQNYPNPFNPKTNIKYQISKSKSYVKLVVFDITGREIAELVNEEQTAGTYLLDWNASRYSSGIYFYSLYIDSKLIDTKKMILVK
jgi:hypothetical protein